MTCRVRCPADVPPWAARGRLPRFSLGVPVPRQRVTLPQTPIKEDSVASEPNVPNRPPLQLLDADLCDRVEKVAGLAGTSAERQLATIVQDYLDTFARNLRGDL
jgi:hypothetical protein